MEKRYVVTIHESKRRYYAEYLRSDEVKEIIHVIMRNCEQYYSPETLCSAKIVEFFDSRDEALKYAINKIKDDYWFLDEKYPYDLDIYNHALNEGIIRDGDHMLVRGGMAETEDVFAFIVYKYTM